MRNLTLPLIIVAVGVGWLLTELQVVEGVNWLLPVVAIGAGLALLVAGGVDKLTVVIGPLLMVIGVLSYLRQTGYIELRVELPVIIIAFGVFAAVSALGPFRGSVWLGADPREVSGRSRSEGASTGKSGSEGGA